MKKLKLLLALVIASLCIQLCSAENYYRPGTEWLIEVTKTNFGDGGTQTKSLYKYRIGQETEVNREMVMPYYGSLVVPVPSETLLYYFRTEGEKVYWRSIDPEYPEWYLMYDFGLQPGESATVYRLFNMNQVTTGELMECTGTDVSLPNKTGKWMTLRQKGDESFDWIMGIGGPRGPEHNCYIGDEGIEITQKILEVSSNGEIVYKTATSGVESVESLDFTIKVEGSSLLMSNVPVGAQVSIYAANGQVVTSFIATEKSNSVHLDSPGIYIVRVGNKSVKVMVN